MQEYALSYVHEYFEMVVYSFAAFFIPLFIRHPQLAVGITVNALLILAALNLKTYKLIPVIILPSIGALTAGILFTKFTIFLVYLMPFIWIGNSILIFSFKYLNLMKNKNYLLTLVIGSGLKAGFLFTSAFVLFKLGIIPIIFLTAMGIMQLTTALGGGVAAYVVQNIKKFYS